MIWDIRPDDTGGAWVKVVLDIPAHHDERLSESAELSVYISGVLGKTISQCEAMAMERAAEVTAAVSDLLRVR